MALAVGAAKMLSSGHHLTGSQIESMVVVMLPNKSSDGDNSNTGNDASNNSSSRKK